MAWLSLEERDDSRKKVRIGTRAVLGRSTAVDIALQHKDISREHACIEEREGLFFSDIFRGYRYPYDWVPQLDQPDERAVVPPAHGEFRIAPVGE